jgi:hypothetical protein
MAARTVIHSRLPPAAVFSIRFATTEILMPPGAGRPPPCWFELEQAYKLWLGKSAA